MLLVSLRVQWVLLSVHHGGVPIERRGGDPEGCGGSWDSRFLGIVEKSCGFLGGKEGFGSCGVCHREECGCNKWGDGDGAGEKRGSHVCILCCFYIHGSGDLFEGVPVRNFNGVGCQESFGFEFEGGGASLSAPCKINYSMVRDMMDSMVDMV